MAKDFSSNSASSGSRIPRLVPVQHRGHDSGPTKFEQLARNFKRIIEEERVEKIVNMRHRQLHKNSLKQNGYQELQPRWKQKQTHTTYNSSQPHLVPRPPAGPRNHDGYSKRSAGRDKSNPLPPILNGRRSSTGSIVSTVPSPVNDQQTPFVKKPRLPNRKPKVNGHVNGYTSDDDTRMHMLDTDVGKKNIKPSPKVKDNWLAEANEKYSGNVVDGTNGYDQGNSDADSGVEDFHKWRQERKLLQNRAAMQRERSDSSRYSSHSQYNYGNSTDKKPPIKSSSRNSQRSISKADRQSVLQRYNSMHQARSDDEDTDVTSSASSDGVAEIKRKEAELQAVLERQMDELRRMQQEKEREAKLERQAEERFRQKKGVLKKQQKQFKVVRNDDRGHESPHQGRKSSLQSATPTRLCGDSPSPKSTEPPRHRENRTKRDVTKTRKPSHDVPVKTPEMNGNTEFYLNATNDPDALPDDLDLVACHMCGRKFATERLAKHSTICKKSNKKPARKVFDPVKMRLAGTEQAQYVDKSPPKPSKKKTNWRTQHENFIATIRYAKEITKAEAEGGDAVRKVKPPPVTENPDYVQCPHCRRRFNASSAERHIPWCKEVKSRPPQFKTKRT